MGDFEDVIDQLGDPDDVHYRVVLIDGAFTVVCVQRFDYRDYGHAVFVEPLAFKDEQSAYESLGRFFEEIGLLSM